MNKLTQQDGCVIHAAPISIVWAKAGMAGVSA